MYFLDLKRGFEIQDVKVDPITVEDAGIVLRVDQGDPFAQSQGNLQSGERFSAACNAAEPNAGVLDDLLGFLEAGRDRGCCVGVHGNTPSD